MSNQYQSSDANLEARVLKREIGLPECVTIIAGAVIGVGLFTVGSAQVGIWGSSIIFAAIISLVITIFPSALYGELASALPLAGGTYAYAKRAINYPVGIFVSWNYHRCSDRNRGCGRSRICKLSESADPCLWWTTKRPGSTFLRQHTGADLRRNQLFRNQICR